MQENLLWTRRYNKELNGSLIQGEDIFAPKAVDSAHEGITIMGWGQQV